MFPNLLGRRASSPAKQSGSMLVISLFVIIVFSLLGLTLSRLLSASSNAIIYEVYGQRALNAARAGIEQKIADTFPLNSGTPNCSSTINQSFSGVPGLEDCSVQSSCEAVAVTDGAITHTYYKFSSTGTCQAGDIIASRTVNVDGML